MGSSGSKREDQGGDLENDTTGKYGTPVKYDASFKGPIENRGCTDIICCIIFIVFIIGLFCVGGYAWLNGNPNKLIHPTDYRGQMCGYDPFVKDKPYLLYFDMIKCTSATTLFKLQCPTKQICVSECPEISWSGIQDDITYHIGGRDSVDWEKYICDYEIDPKGFGKPPSELFEYEECAAYYFESKPLVGRCIPSFLVDAVDIGKEVVKDLNGNPMRDSKNNTITNEDVIQAEKAIAVYLEGQAIVANIFSDLNESWPFMLVGSVLGMLICLLWIVVMRWIVGVMVWLSILITFVLLGIGIYCCAAEYSQLAKVDDSSIEFQFTLELEAYLKMKETWLAFTIILSIVTLILLILVISLCTRIRLAIALIKEGSRAVSCMMSTLLWPLIPFVLQVALFAVWALMAVYLATSSSSSYMVADTPSEFPQGNGSECDITDFDNLGTTAKCVFIEYTSKVGVTVMQVYALLGLFWLMNFIVAFGEMVLAGAFASYYWAFVKPDEIPALPVLKSVWRSIRYHLGSLALGSLIIAIVQLARVTLEYIDHKLKGAENRVAKFILKCMMCCLWCLEKFLRFLNKNAYIMIAIYGKNFCTSAKNAFFLLMRNIVRVVVLDKLADFLLFLSKLMVTAGIGVIAYFFFAGKVTWYDEYFARHLGDFPSLNYFWVPIVVVCVLTYMIASVFFSVYSMAIDTLFLCFLEDLERNDGSAEKPYYMNKELRNIAGVKNKVKRYKL